MMDDLSLWNNERTRMNYLTGLLSKGRISLVLGAGVSVSFGLPTWESLIQTLYSLKKKTRNTTIGLEAQAEYFKESICKGKEDEYKVLLQKALYRDFKLDFPSLKDISTLSAIGSLVMASKRGNASNVISFNFDNILELYLEYHGFVTNSRFQTSDWSSNADIIIYHPHGFISAPPKKVISKDIIFDKHSYSKTIGDDKNPWRQLVLNIFRSHFCIFIGLSGNDDNLDSFLVWAKENHPAILESSMFWGMTFEKNPSKESKQRWEKRGIYVRTVKDYNVDVPKDLFMLCQMAATKLADFY